MPRWYQGTVLLLALSLSACGDSESSDNLANVAVNDLEFPQDDLNSFAEIESPANVTEAPACANPPASGDRLEGQQISGSGHVLAVDNGTGSDAIIKLRSAGDRRLVTSFFVARSTSGSISGIPDGNYVVQYALGPTLAEDCKSFITIESAGEFEDEESLVTGREEAADGVRLTRSRLTYTLHPVPGGTERPQPIDPSTFNAD